MSQHVEDYVDGRNNENYLEDTFEAFIGAMYEEFKVYGRKHATEICFTFIENVFTRSINFTELITMDDNYKDQLMRYYHKMFETTPTYKEAIDSNPTVDTTANPTYSGLRTFHIYVYDRDGKVVSEGFGKSKQDAEQDCAKNALVHYKVL
jgi:dsRNA-specific ribonuclease